MTLTAEQTQSLSEEFVDHKIEEMSYEEMADWIRVVYMAEMQKATDEEIKDEIDRYDKNLYDILVSCVKDEEDSWEAFEEYKHDLHANDWIDS